MTYTVIVKFTVIEASDDHLRSTQAIEDEITSWLESLKAKVERVSVTEGESQ